MVLLDIDIPDVVGYHLCTKSGWNSWSLYLRILPHSRRFPSTTVPASERPSDGGQPIPQGVGTVLQGCSNFSSGGRLNANLVRGPQNARPAVHNLL